MSVAAMAEERRRRIPVRVGVAGTVLGLSLLAAVALWLRAAAVRTLVLGGSSVRFLGNDAWYHVRFIENLLAHFPLPSTWDSYLAPGGGSEVPVAPGFDLLVGTVAWLAGWGHPSAARVEIIAAWAPAVMGALLVLPCWWIARRLWGPFGGWTAAALAAVLPGALLDRTLLGATDHHAAEILLSTVVLGCLISAASDVQESLRRSRILGVLAGLALTAYLLSWRSGTLLVLLLAVWGGSLLVLDARGDARSDGALEVFWPLFLAPLLLLPLFLPIDPFLVTPIVVLGGSLASLAVGVFVLRRLRGRSTGTRLLALGWIGLAGAAGVWLIAPGAIHRVLINAGRLWPRGAGSTINEMTPLLQTGAGLTPFHREFAWSFPFAAAGLVLVAIAVWRKQKAADLLLLVWSGVMLLITFGQSRFAYYLGVVVALLAAAAVAALFDLTAKVARERRGGFRAVLAAGVVLLLLVPAMRLGARQAERSVAPHDDWLATLGWLREHSPEPFEHDVWSARERRGESGEEAKYSVLSWWDAGYWVLAIGHRVPAATPTQHNASAVARALISRNEISAEPLLDELGVRYLVLDGGIPARQLPGNLMSLGTFEAMARWAGEPVTDFFERYEIQAKDGSWKPVTLFYQSYFETLAIRLYLDLGLGNRSGRSTWVFEYQTVEQGDGTVVKRIVRARRFARPDQAVQAMREPSEYEKRIASTDPFEPPLPVERLRTIRPIYQSPTPTARRAWGNLTRIEVFRRGRRIR